MTDQSPPCSPDFEDRNQIYTSDNADCQSVVAWENWPWRPWLLILAAVVPLSAVFGAIWLSMPIQVTISRFMMPPYSYACLGLAVIALTESRESIRRRVFMGIALILVAVLSVLSYAAGGISPLIILGIHMAFLLAWPAWEQRTIWTGVWLMQTLAWIGIAIHQGRL